LDLRGLLLRGGEVRGEESKGEGRGVKEGKGGGRGPISSAGPGPPKQVKTALVAASRQQLVSFTRSTAFYSRPM